MTLLPRGVKVHLAFGFIDMRKGHRRARHAGPGCAAAGALLGLPFRFPGPESQPRQDLGTGPCLFTKRLEHGVFLWASNVEPGGTPILTSGAGSVLWLIGGALARVMLLRSSKTENALILKSETALAPRLI
jgi:transposase